MPLWRRPAHARPARAAAGPGISAAPGAACAARHRCPAPYCCARAAVRGQARTAQEARFFPDPDRRRPAGRDFANGVLPLRKERRICCQSPKRPGMASNRRGRGTRDLVQAAGQISCDGHAGRLRQFHPAHRRQSQRLQGGTREITLEGSMPIGKKGLMVFLLTAFAGVTAARSAGIPHYKNDVSWPKPFPNHWVIGQIGGLSVDSDDHIWVLQRPLPYALDDAGVKQTIAPALRMPSVLEFDTAGNILKSWGGQGYVPDWPKSEHALWRDAAGNVWIGGNAPGDRQVLK